MKYWWKSLAPAEDIEYFYIDLCSKKISRHASMDKIRTRCCLCEVNNESINHILDEFPIEGAIWERDSGVFKKNHRHKGRHDLTIAKWPKNIFKNKIVNKVWELFLRFIVWEIWKTRNLKFFENKQR